MNYISTQELSKSFLDKVLFDKISFSIEKGQRNALIAKNGTGKTTLLKIITGSEEPDSGEIIINKEIKIGYLSQDTKLVEDSLVIDEIYNSKLPIVRSLKLYDQILNGLSDKPIEKVIEDIDDLKGWDFEVKIKQIISKLKIDFLTQKVGSLSGGQKKRVAMAKTLIDSPDFLILDEPTNHLDLDMIEWLENYLMSNNITLLMVTHDRYFLERICNQIFELDQGNIYAYKGNYSTFLTKKSERELIEQKESSKAKNMFKKELEWIRKQPRGRGTKSRARVEAFDEISDKANKKINNDKLELNIKMKRLGGKVLELKNISKSYSEKKIIRDFSYNFSVKERIGIIGKNGVGKSTFLNIITGKEKQDKGELDTGITISFGYYSQSGMNLKDDKRVIDVVKEVAEFIELEKGKLISASKFLEKFLFPASTQYTYISKLSGGEKRRLYLMTILMKNPNFLILDEPTNDLDVVTLSVLEDFLESYKGCLVIVSHDRFFMDKLVNKMLIFEGEGEISSFVGNYSDYYEKKKDDEKIEKEYLKEKSKKASNPEKQKTKLTYKEKLEYEKLEAEIEKLEEKKVKMSEELNSITTEYDKLQSLSEELGEVVSSIDQKTERWLELSEYA